MESTHSLIFIPDIGGFTQFVSQTEISHSQHVIRELLQILMDSNELGLRIAEVEGDAIFFYSQGVSMGPEELFGQIRKMYLAFHTHLKQYALNRICPCGACSTAINLKLKFVVHSGPFTFMDILGRRKPYGPEVILAHRLLKNNVPVEEYILFSGEELIQGLPESSISSLLEAGSIDFPNFGKVLYLFGNLAPYREDVKYDMPRLQGTQGKLALREEIFIDRPKQLVYEIVSNLEYRHAWNPDVDSLEYNKDRVNRIGTKHLCVIGNNKIEFETVSKNLGQSRLVYGEKVLNFPIVKEFTTYFVIEGKGEGTLLCVEVQYKPLPVIGWLFVPLFRSRFRKQIRKAIELIRELSEQKSKDSYLISSV